MSAAVGTAASVETATAAGATTHRAASAAVESISTAEATTDRAASDCSALCESIVSTEAASAPVKAASTIVEVAPKSGTSKAAEPRAGTDKQTARKILGAVVTVRRARIGVIAIVTVGAYGRWTNTYSHRPYAYRNANLRLGATCSEYN